MIVTAFSTPRDPAWRWRIVNAAGETVVESEKGFPSIGAALAAGGKSLVAMNVVDRSQPVTRRRWTSFRGRGPAA